MTIKNEIFSCTKHGKTFQSGQGPLCCCCWICSVIKVMDSNMYTLSLREHLSIVYSVERTDLVGYMRRDTDDKPSGKCSTQYPWRLSDKCCHNTVVILQLHICHWKRVKKILNDSIPKVHISPHFPNYKMWIFGRNILVFIVY